MDAYDPSSEGFARLPVAPFPADYITSNLCSKKDEASRKRKRNADGTLQDGGAAQTENPSSSRAEQAGQDSKQLKKEAAKARKSGSVGADRSSKKAADKLAKKKAPKDAAVDQRKGNKTSTTPKSGNPDKASQPSEASEPPSDSPRHESYRPQYDSVFSH